MTGEIPYPIKVYPFYFINLYFMLFIAHNFFCELQNLYTFPKPPVSILTSCYSKFDG
jgi:hypothetical protein